MTSSTKSDITPICNTPSSGAPHIRVARSSYDSLDLSQISQRAAVKLSMMHELRCCVYTSAQGGFISSCESLTDP
jgi:hypothetical protein